jgi:hypothetical protein
MGCANFIGRFIRVIGAGELIDLGNFYPMGFLYPLGGQKMCKFSIDSFLSFLKEITAQTEIK